MSLVPVAAVTVKIERDWDSGGEDESARGPREPQHEIINVKQELEDKNLSIDTCWSKSSCPVGLTNYAEHDTAIRKEAQSNVDSSATETYKCDMQSINQEESGLDNTDNKTATAGTKRRGQQGGRSKSHKQTSPEEEPYSCGICHKKFRHISNLNIHERIHTGEKPFSCEVCKQRFAQLSNLKVHKRIHTGEKPYACGTCEQRFTMLSNLKKHERIHTGDKPYSCVVCQQKFTLLGNLKTHERIHTGEKIYSCGTCERKFTQLSSLKSHERTHTGEKPFWCDLCQKGYTRKTHLDQHVRKKKKLPPARDVAPNRALVKSEPV